MNALLEKAAEAAAEAAEAAEVISLDLPLGAQVEGVCRRAAASAGATVLSEEKAPRPVQLAWALWAQASWKASFEMALKAIEKAERMGAAAARRLL